MIARSMLGNAVAAVDLERGVRGRCRALKAHRRGAADRDRRELILMAFEDESVSLNAVVFNSQTGELIIRKRAEAQCVGRRGGSKRDFVELIELKVHSNVEDAGRVVAEIERITRIRTLGP